MRDQSDSMETIIKVFGVLAVVASGLYALGAFAGLGRFRGIGGPVAGIIMLFFVLVQAFIVSKIFTCFHDCEEVPVYLKILSLFLVSRIVGILLLVYNPGYENCSDSVDGKVGDDRPVMRRSSDEE